MCYSIDDGYVTLRLKIQPGASKSVFAGMYGQEACKVRIAAPAVEGAANKELVKFLSKQFRVPKSSVEIVSGLTSRHKTVLLPYTDAFAAWARTYAPTAP